MKPKPLAALVAVLSAVPLSAAEPTRPPAPVFVPAAPPVRTPRPVAVPPPTPTSPKDLPGRMEISPDGETLFFSGIITSTSYAALNKMLAANPRVKRLDLASSGGLVLTGRLMGSLVIRHKLAVHVEHLCASACTLVLLASNERTMGPVARIGFHKSYRWDEPRRAASRPAESSKIEGQAERYFPARTDAVEANPSSGGDALELGDQLSRSSLINAGVDRSFADRALATSSDDMWYPDGQELLAAKVVHAQTPTRRATDPSWYLSRDAIAAALPAPMWPALREYDPGLWDDAVESIWFDRDAGASEMVAVDAARATVIDELLMLLPRAPRGMSARLASIHGDQARHARMTDYRICELDPFERRVPTAIERAQVVLEDAALADLMQLTTWEKPMSINKARKIFDKFLESSLVEAMLLADEDKGSQADCRVGLQLLEILGALPEKQRGDIYRAMMTLPD